MKIVGKIIGIIALIHILAAAVIFITNLDHAFGEKQAAFMMRVASLGILDMGLILLALAALVWHRAEKP